MTPVCLHHRWDAERPCPAYYSIVVSIHQRLPFLLYIFTSYNSPVLDPYAFIASSIVADNLIRASACKRATPTQILHHRRTVTNPHRMMHKRRKQFLQCRDRFKHDVRRPLRLIHRPVILRFQRAKHLRQSGQLPNVNPFSSFAQSVFSCSWAVPAQPQYPLYAQNSCRP